MGGRTADSDRGDLNRAPYYSLIRIEHEDQTVNQRVIWQIISQAFFFGAYGGLLNAPRQSKDAMFEALQYLMLWAMPLAALAAGAITYISILASLRTMAYLRTLYESYSGEPEPDDSSSKLYPAIHGPKLIRWWASLAPIAMPIVFIITWLVVLVRLIAAA